MKPAEEWAPEFCFGGDIIPDVITIVRRIQADASGHWVIPAVQFNLPAPAVEEELKQLRDERDKLVKLLTDAACPNCSGSGIVMAKIRDRQLVTREMALDAGQPEMEGSVYCDDEWEQQQCRWCDERKTALERYQPATKEVEF